MAEKLNVTDKAVSRWERGVGLPDINMLEPLTKVLDISYAEIINSERNFFDENIEGITYFKKIHQWEQIRIMIYHFAMLLLVEMLFIIGQLTRLLIVTRLIMMYMVPLMGLTLVIHGLLRRSEKLSYKLLLGVGTIIFIPLTLIFICDFIMVKITL